MNLKPFSDFVKLCRYFYVSLFSQILGQNLFQEIERPGIIFICLHTIQRFSFLPLFSRQEKSCSYGKGDSRGPIKFFSWFPDGKSILFRSEQWSEVKRPLSWQARPCSLNVPPSFSLHDCEPKDLQIFFIKNKKRNKQKLYTYNYICQFFYIT